MKSAEIESFTELPKRCTIQEKWFAALTAKFCTLAFGKAGITLKVIIRTHSLIIEAHAYRFPHGSVIHYTIMADANDWLGTVWLQQLLLWQNARVTFRLFLST